MDTSLIIKPGLHCCPVLRHYLYPLPGQHSPVPDQHYSRWPVPYCCYRCSGHYWQATVIPRLQGYWRSHWIGIFGVRIHRGTGQQPRQGRQDQLW